MTVVIDTAPLVALADRGDPLRPRIQRVLTAERGELVIPAPVTAELDYLLGRRVGRAARLAFLSDVAAERFTIACLGADDHAVILDLERRYPRLDAGLADLSVVVVAQRHRTNRVLTFDERHFRALRTLEGWRFTLLPFDEAATSS